MPKWRRSFAPIAPEFTSKPDDVETRYGNVWDF